MLITSCLKLGASNYRDILQRLLSLSKVYIVGLPIILLYKLFLLSNDQISLSYHFVHVYLKYTVQENVNIIVLLFCFNVIYLIVRLHNLNP